MKSYIYKDDNDLVLEDMLSSIEKNKIEHTLNEYFKNLDKEPENKKGENFEKAVPYKDIKDAMKMTNDTAEEFLKHSKLDRRLKIGYGIGLIVMLIGQIIYLNFVFYQVGLGILIFPNNIKTLICAF